MDRPPGPRSSPGGATPRSPSSGEGTRTQTAKGSLPSTALLLQQSSHAPWCLWPRGQLQAGGEQETRLRGRDRPDLEPECPSPSPAPSGCVSRARVLTGDTALTVGPETHHVSVCVGHASGGQSGRAGGPEPRPETGRDVAASVHAALPPSPAPSPGGLPAALLGRVPASSVITGFSAALATSHHREPINKPQGRRECPAVSQAPCPRRAGAASCPVLTTQAAGTRVLDRPAASCLGPTPHPGPRTDAASWPQTVLRQLLARRGRAWQGPQHPRAFPAKGKSLASFRRTKAREIWLWGKERGGLPADLDPAP